MTETATTTNERVAAELAASGYSVFPCHAGGDQIKRPMPGIFWRSVSTSDHTKVRGWWRRWPDAAVGIDLAKSGLIVVDADRHGEADGVAAIAELMHEHQFDPNGVPVVGTPNEGTHFYFRQRHGEELGNGRGALPAGVDIRGSGGFVIAPGTVMSDGRRYEIFGNLCDAPMLPDWLHEIISGPVRREVVVQAVTVPSSARPSDDRVRAYVESALDQELAAVRSAPRGQRNHQLNTSAFSIGQLVGAGWVSEGEAAGLLENAAEALSQDDGVVQTRKTIRSGLSAGRREPRQMPEATGHELGPQDFAMTANLKVQGVSVRPRQLTEHGDGTITDENGEVVEPRATQRSGRGSLDYPAGLVGLIARWITDTARRPQPDISIGAALAVVGSAAGRQIAGPTGAGTALYILCLAPTAGGKDHPMKQARRIFNAAGLPHHLGPDEFMSMSSVINTIVEKPLCFAPMDEFGDFMRRVYGRRSGSHERSIPKILRSAWSTNFDPFVTPVWADKASISVEAAHLTILGGSTHDQFYSALESGAAQDGTLNRFMIIDVDKRVAEVEPRIDRYQVPDEIVSGLKSIYFRSGEYAVSTRTIAEHNPGEKGDIVNLGWGPGAKQVYEQFGQSIEARMEVEPRNADSLSRASEMSIRIATIIATGRGDSVVTTSDMTYARDIVMRSVDMMISGADDYMAENETHANSQKIVRLIKARNGKAAYRDIMQSMRNMKARDLRDLLASMCEAELIEKVDLAPKGPQQGGGHKVVHYLIRA